MSGAMESWVAFFVINHNSDIELDDNPRFEMSPVSVAAELTSSVGDCAEIQLLSDFYPSDTFRVKIPWFCTYV